MAITLSIILDRFAKLFHCCKEREISNKSILGYPPHLKYVAALTWKIKNQKFALCIHVKHVSSVTFYHLSDRYLPNVMKISAKINTIRMSTFYFLFVYCPCRPNELKEGLIAVWSDFRQDTIGTAIDQCRKRLHTPGMCPCKWWTFEHLLLTNSCKQLAFFMCFWFRWLLSIFYCVDA